MKQGEVVTIYEDPETQEKVEGKAKLIKFLDYIAPGTEYWKVEFLDEPNRPYHRLIKSISKEQQ